MGVVTISFLEAGLRFYSDNTRVGDTSNRAIQVILNNPQGVFSHDDDMERMAFAVAGEWGEKGFTAIYI